jgi:hypothetical protein
MLYLKIGTNYDYASLILCTESSATIRQIPSGFYFLLFPKISAPVTKLLPYCFAVQVAAHTKI